MKKKFKTKIERCFGEQYMILYTHYYIFKSWCIIEEYIDDLGYNVPILLKKDQAILLMNKFKSIEDVNRFNENQKQLRQNYYINYEN